MRKAIIHLKKSDPVMRGIIERVGPCRMGFSEPVFHSLAEAIVYQQLTGKAAATILGRLCALSDHGRFPSAEELRALSTRKLRAAGLSRANALIMIPRRSGTLEPGEAVQFLPLD